MFQRNVGGIDRVLRLALGAMLFVGGLLLLTGKATLGLTLAIVGLLALLTGIVRFCVLYIPFGFSTAPTRLRQNRPLCQCAEWRGLDRAESAAPDPDSSSARLENETVAHRG